MTTVGTAEIPIKPDFGAFDKAMRSKTKKLTASFASAGKLAALSFGAALGAGAATFAFGKKVLDTGAQLESFRKKATTVFEGSAADIRKWADDNNEIFGVTDDQLVGLAANFGDLLKPMGFTADQAGLMAKDVVGLSGALSEWTGGQRSASEVSEIFAAAMLGEREALKSLGISITDNDVKARLAAKGQEKLTGAALEQAKAVATQELIFEKSTDAQAAFAAGGNEALRASNELKAGLGELWEQLVERALPIVTEITKWMAENLPVAFARAQEIVAELRAKWDEVFPEIERIVGDFVDFVMDLWDEFGDEIVKFATDTWETVQRIVKGAFDVVQGLFNAFAGILTGDWARLWEGIKQAASGIWEVLLGIVKFKIDKLVFILSMAWEMMDDLVRSGWEAIKRATADAVVALIDKVVAIGTRIQQIASEFPGKMMQAGKDMIQGLIDGIGSMGSALASYVSDFVKRNTIDKVTSLLGIFSPSRVFYEFGENTIQGYLDGLKDNEQNLADTMASIFQGAVDGVNTIFSSLGAIRGREDAQQDLIDAERDLAELRAREGALPSEIADAERELAKARAAGATAGSLGTLERQLMELRREHSGIAREIADAERDVEDAMVGVVQAEARLITAGESLLELGPGTNEMFEQVAHRAGLSASAVAGLADRYHELAAASAAARAQLQQDTLNVAEYGRSGREVATDGDGYSRERLAPADADAFGRLAARAMASEIQAIVRAG